MVKKVLVLAGCVFMLVLSSVAFAQSLDDISQGWTLRGGFFFPLKTSAQDAQGDVWGTVGAERLLYQGQNWEGTFSLDYYGNGNLYSIPFKLNLRTVRRRVRMGFGAGISVGHDSQHGINAFCYEGLLGYEIKGGEHPVDLDLRYMGTLNSRNELDGLALTLGIGM